MSKIDSWPMAIVLVAGIAGTVGTVMFLVSAGWSDGAIGGFATLAVSLFTGLVAMVRKTAIVEAKTDVQSDQLDRIVRQTNGLSTQERQDIAERAAAAVLARQAASRVEGPL